VTHGAFFSGGLGGEAHGAWKTWSCFRDHPCLDHIQKAGSDAVCYKRNSADGSWLLWGLQVGLVLIVGRCWFSFCFVLPGARAQQRLSSPYS
jgi:hypothetical protein